MEGGLPKGDQHQEQSWSKKILLATSAAPLVVGTVIGWKEVGDIVDYPFNPLLLNASLLFKKKAKIEYAVKTLLLNYHFVFILEYLDEWLVNFGKWPAEKWVLATVIYATHILWPFCVPPEMCGDHIKKLNMEWNHSNIVYIFTFMARSTNTPTETINEDT